MPAGPYLLKMVEKADQLQPIGLPAWEGLVIAQAPRSRLRLMRLNQRYLRRFVFCSTQFLNQIEQRWNNKNSDATGSGHAADDCRAHDLTRNRS